MQEEIGENIEVAVIFRQGRIYPRSFSWHNRAYKILKVTSSWHVPEGQFRRYYYTVVTEQPNIYELMLSTNDMQWKLMNIYYE